MVIARPGRLLPGPLCDWLGDQLRERTRTELAERMGVDRRQIHRWLTSDTIPTFGPVDRALSRAGVPLQAVYPETGELPSNGCRLACSRCGDELLTPAPLCGFCIEETSA